MNPYTVAELHELSLAILEAGLDSFIVRRTLDRVETGRADNERSHSHAPDRDCWQSQLGVSCFRVLHL